MEVYPYTLKLINLLATIFSVNIHTLQPFIRRAFPSSDLDRLTVFLEEFYPQNSWQTICAIDSNEIIACLDKRLQFYILFKSISVIAGQWVLIKGCME